MQKKNSSSQILLARAAMSYVLFDLLFQATEKVRMKEVVDCDTETITELLDSTSCPDLIVALDEVPPIYAEAVAAQRLFQGANFHKGIGHRNKELPILLFYQVKRFVCFV